jgi:voltage-gated potassium channel
VPFFLTRLLARLSMLTKWATPVVVVVFVFVTSWPLMVLAEPAGSALVTPANYWWFFVVTSATVGYGDFFPETGAGHVVGTYVIVGGIATLTTVFTKLASVLEQAKGRRMQGAISVKASGHVVVLGYLPGRTERIVDQLLADDCRVVLCAWDDAGTHPMPERDVDFVRGDLTEEETLRRASVHTAATVLVDARDDNEALAITVTVHHVNPTVHLVVPLRDLDRATLLRRINRNIRCVQWHSPRMITEELTTPGIAEVYADLMTHGGGANTYSVRLPESLGPVLVDHCQTALGRRHGAIVLAVRTDDELMVNPPWHAGVPAGAVLYYVSTHPLTVEQVADTLRDPVPDGPSASP